MIAFKMELNEEEIEVGNGKKPEQNQPGAAVAMRAGGLSLLSLFSSLVRSG